MIARGGKAADFAGRIARCHYADLEVQIESLLGNSGPLADALSRKGRAVVLLGEAAEAIARAVGERVPVHRAATMDEAVRVGASLALRGDAVLLSPACSSFDMFRDYKHRGDEFVRAVRILEKEAAG